MIEVREYNGYQNTIFIDGEVLPAQTLNDPKIVDGVIVVECITDGRISRPAIVSAVKYQVKPPETFKRNDGIEVTRFFIKP